LPALRKADILVLVSPIYYFTLSAQLKAALDRTFALLKVTTPIKKAALLMTCADETEDVADGVLLTFNNICKYSNWENGGSIIVTGVNDCGEIENRAELKQAENLGREI